MSFGKLKVKASVMKRTKRITLKEPNNTNGAQESEDANGDANISLTAMETPSSKRPESVRGNFRQRMARRASNGILKNIRRKLTLNRVRNSMRDSGHEHLDETDNAFNGITASNKSNKQTKTSLRTICPMPSLIHVLNRSGLNQNDDIQQPSLTLASDVSCNSSASTSALPKSVSLHDSSSTDSVADRPLSNPGTDKSDANITTVTATSNIDVPSLQLITDESLQNYTTPSSDEPQGAAECKVVSRTGQHLTVASEDISDLYTTPRARSLTVELVKLPRYGWYWGPITRSEAEDKLLEQPDGAFLVRDSSDDRYLLSLSFRSFGKTLHTRIEHSNGTFSFYSHPESDGHNSIIDLIEHSMNYSQSGVFCYSRARTPGAPSYPVRLTKPVSRFTQVRSLQYLCRFVIRQYTRIDLINELPLPNRMKGYVEERQF